MVLKCGGRGKGCGRGGAGGAAGLRAACDDGGRLNGGAMPEAIRLYVRWVEAVNRRVGRVAMYGIFVLIGILLWSSVSKSFFLPSLRPLELAQFAVVAYYVLGGPYSLQLAAHVPMAPLSSPRTPPP